MKKVVLLFFLLLLVALPSTGRAADDLRKNAQEDPLQCALYLLSKDRGLISEASLQRAFFEAKNYTGLERSIDLDAYDKVSSFSIYAVHLSELGEKAAAEKFIDKALAALKEYEWQDLSIRMLVPLLIKTGRLDDLSEILSHQDEDQDKAKILITAAEAFSKSGKNETALKYLKQAYELRETFADIYELLTIAELYLNLAQNDRALEITAQLENTALTSSEENEQHRIFMFVVPLYAGVGQPDKAIKLWQQYHNPDYPDDTIILFDILNRTGRFDEAKPLLLELESGLGSNGDWMVKTYLELNDIENAKRIAKAISAENDAPRQQDAFMSLADKWISEGENNSALAILDTAFQKAKKVGEEHRAEDSNGASPLTRKIIYLGAIEERYLKLKRFDKIAAIAGAFSSPGHDFAAEFIAGSLIASAKAQLGSLPNKKVIALLDQAQQVVSGKKDDTGDNEYLRNGIRVSIADVYAKMGNKTEAVELLAKALKDIRENEHMYVNQFLISTGRVFEEHKLKATPNLRKVLGEILKEVK
ncbi:MAG TPA: hypothetical protein VGO50_09240 [Pyrinomonadaceae bacterium]|jgi:tetratricopeptide (TPR) repeat protein|nr:hypothetical protein [Pyrinomonadaceae bacterium]